jgi:hypothetical protein
MSAASAPPGWHPDPSNPTGSLRWWDGSQWTGHTRPIPAASTGTVPLAATAWYGQGFRSAGGTGASVPYGAGNPSFATRNQRSLLAIGVAAAYILIAVTTHIVFFGIIPIMASIRAANRREPLTAFAIAAAVVAVAVAVGSLALR